jgi:hypothetical protein
MTSSRPLRLRLLGSMGERESGVQESRFCSSFFRMSQRACRRQRRERKEET